ncbi:hypothetical protein [Paraburkholderia kururiensis]|uniref:hypothetical protein n=1 Tax=Paraburkholderia kururiensis TaxID=984307 RepID=UPI0003492FC6|nr:hypothetical protein [Paraburkholderia kururiensis]
MRLKTFQAREYCGEREKCAAQRVGLAVIPFTETAREDAMSGRKPMEEVLP